MSGEERQRLLLPTPVFKNLGGQLDEVPGDTDAGERLNFDLAKEMVQQVAELVEDRGDLVMRQQRRLTRNRGCEITAHQA